MKTVIRLRGCTLISYFDGRTCEKIRFLSLPLGCIRCFISCNFCTFDWGRVGGGGGGEGSYVLFIHAKPREAYVSAQSDENIPSSSM